MKEHTDHVAYKACCLAIPLFNHSSVSIRSGEVWSAGRITKQNFSVSSIISNYFNCYKNFQLVFPFLPNLLRCMLEGWIICSWQILSEKITVFFRKFYQNVWIWSDFFSFKFSNKFEDIYKLWAQIVPYVHVACILKWYLLQYILKFIIIFIVLKIGLKLTIM